MRRGRRWIAGAGMLAVMGAATAWLATGRGGRYGGLAAAEVAPYESPSVAYTLARVALASRSGLRMDCMLRRPGQPAAHRRAVVLLGGIRTGRRAATLVHERFDGVVLSCDYPWEDPSAYSTWRFLLRLPAIRREVLGTPQALALAATYLVTVPGVDSTRLVAIGASLGVPFVAAWAADDLRVRAVALVYGGGNLAALFEANLRGRIRTAWLRRAVAGSAARLLGALEPTRAAPRIAPRPLLVVGAAEDQRIPRAAVVTLYRAARPPKALRWFGGRHMLPTERALLEALTDSTVAWLEAALPQLPASGR